jgi:hypothetical protein
MNMAIEIENIPVQPIKRASRSDDWQDFLSAIKTMEVRQSFLVPQLGSNFRLAMTVAQTLLDKQYITNKTASGVRVGRIK